MSGKPIPARAAALVGLVAATVGCKAAWCAIALTSPGVEAILPLSTIPETTASMAAPRFDAWAPQPRLACSLPAIEAWDVVRNVHARTDVPFDVQSGVGPPQIIFAQRPFHNPGLSKYSVIYQASRRDLDDRNDWFQLAAAFHVRFRESLAENKQFKTIRVSSPTVSTIAPLRRVYVEYQIEKTTGGLVSGAILCVPARGGVLFYTLTLEGQGPEAVESVMRELRHAVNIGLTKHGRPVRPYVVAALLAVPLVVAVVLIIHKRRLLAKRQR